MEKPKALIVFYSRTGTTRKVARALASELGCDIEEMIDLRNRAGWIGYIRSLIDASRKRLTNLKEPLYRPELYDLVLIGTPIWAGNLATPVRAYLVQNHQRLKNVAFFLTSGGAGEKKTVAQMELLVGKKPLAVLGLTVNAVRLENFSEQLNQYVRQLKSHFKSVVSDISRRSA